jgi:hypothetical protein
MFVKKVENPAQVFIAHGEEGGIVKPCLFYIPGILFAYRKIPGPVKIRDLPPGIEFLKTPGNKKRLMGIVVFKLKVPVAGMKVVPDKLKPRFAGPGMAVHGLPGHETAVLPVLGPCIRSGAETFGKARLGVAFLPPYKAMPRVTAVVGRSAVFPVMMMIAYQV